MEYLGKGARSTIWRVRERTRNRYYALKRVTKLPGDDDRFFQQATNEFRIASTFERPAIRKYFRLRRVRPWFRVTELHLFMELCEGESCQVRRPNGIAETARVFIVVADALAHMHARGFLHGDIKPNNIILADDGTVKIIDFGQSCPMGTIKERIQGTPDFIAPEQVYCRPLDMRTDIFNFGASLYWTLTGKAIPTVLPKDVNGVQLRDDLRLTPPIDVNPDIPQAMNRLVMDCIEHRPPRRPKTMKEVHGRLDLILHSMQRNGQGLAPADEQPPPDEADDEAPDQWIPPDLLDGLME
ncbi:hypothetical protein LCGC14_1988620 [marine sediment metagenome]|uniref:non-specific serine/threonine protein kinase n=1 Tax=marine sediment metagenome TaxID=412755 RepID=A0A0F9F6Y5_9ZZZZ